MNIPVVFQDQYLMVVDKPAGLVVDPSATQTEPTLADILTADFNIQVERGGIVHRLDKDTSGLLLVAKTPEMLEQLQAQFKERSVKKEYLALVHGHMIEGGVVEGAIGRNPGNREKFIVLEDGKEASTAYQPEMRYQLSEQKMSEFFEGFNKTQWKKLERSHYGLFTLVRCKPLTGRTHQIRVHLKHIGFPLVGDSKYAGRKTSRLDGRMIKRQFLHAAKLEFLHPETLQLVSLESPLPADLQAVLAQLDQVIN